MFSQAYRFTAFLRPSILLPLAFTGIVGVLTGLYFVYNRKKRFIKRKNSVHSALKQVKNNPNKQPHLEQTKVENTKIPAQSSSEKESLFKETKSNFKRNMTDIKEKNMPIVEEEIKAERTRRMAELEQELNAIKEKSFEEIRLKKEKANEEYKSNLEQELETIKSRKMNAIGDEIDMVKRDKMAELKQTLKEFKDIAYKEIRIEKEKTSEYMSSFERKMESLKSQKKALIDAEIKAERTKRMAELEQELKNSKKSSYEELKVEKEMTNKFKQEIESVKGKKMALLDAEIKAEKAKRLSKLENELKEIKDNAYKEIRLDAYSGLHRPPIPFFVDHPFRS